MDATGKGDAMQVQRKRHVRRVFVLLACIAAVLVLALLFLPRYQQPSTQRPPDRYAGAIEQLCSAADADGDGTDDQTDILQGALAYVGTYPKYESRYYAGGSPDDGYGVCTDVVAFALRDAGYDLRQLVSDDIAAHPTDYDVSAPDHNIDFRRVRNLLVYFHHTATALTTDVSQVDQWQGGDIVVFNEHIGIVSDRRNADGVPYVIHHIGPWQRAYEEDILQKRTDIVAHFRV